MLETVTVDASLEKAHTTQFSTVSSTLLIPCFCTSYGLHCPWSLTISDTSVLNSGYQGMWLLCRTLDYILLSSAEHYVLSPVSKMKIMLTPEALEVSQLPLPQGDLWHPGNILRPHSSLS